jgi:hypothetical protein
MFKEFKGFKGLKEVDIESKIPLPGGDWALPSESANWRRRRGGFLFLFLTNLKSILYPDPN